MFENRHRSLCDNEPGLDFSGRTPSGSPTGLLHVEATCRTILPSSFLAVMNQDACVFRTMTMGTKRRFGSRSLLCNGVWFQGVQNGETSGNGSR